MNSDFPLLKKEEKQEQFSLYKKDKDPEDNKDRFNWRKPKKIQ
jgi:hypothetical protein